MFTFLQQKLQQLFILFFSKAQINETAVSHCRLGAIKRQHHAADLAFPPHFVQPPRGVTTDNKHVRTFDRPGRHCRYAGATGGIGSFTGLYIIVINI